MFFHGKEQKALLFFYKKTFGLTSIDFLHFHPPTIFIPLDKMLLFFQK